jgi:phage/plasmid-like protein (TIGR03299 family)
MQKAGLAWEVAKEDVYDAHGKTLPDMHIMRRLDNGRVFGTVGGRYTPLQNAEAFTFFDPFVRSGELTYEKAGSFRGGSWVWIQAKLTGGGADIVKGDEVTPYLTLSHSHDGTLAVSVGFTPIRIVCQNTMLMSRLSGTNLVVRHTKNMSVTLDAILETVDTVKRTFAMSSEQFRHLASLGCTGPALDAYVKAVFGKDDADADKTRFLRTRNDIVRLFEAGAGADIVGVRGTMWGAYNAVIEYLQYESGNKTANDVTRLEKLAFGTNNDVGQRAFSLAMGVA